MKVTLSWVNDGPVDNHAEAFLELQGYELRDLFAGFALAGLSYEHLTPADAARVAYERADAVLAQRDK